VVFLPDYNVNSVNVYAADLCRSLLLARKPLVQGKFSMNGSLTIGTLDGANIEIRAEVGAENFFPWSNG